MIYKALASVRFITLNNTTRNMLWPSILALIAFIIFVLILGTLFIPLILVVGANAVILYFIFLRIYTEITKYKRGDIYALSGAGAVFLLLITGNFLPTWWITTWALLTFIIAHLYINIKKEA